jgi:hypothetical protein
MGASRKASARILVAVLACLGAGGCRVVEEGHWDEIGALAADLNVDHGIIDARGEGRFRAIRIEVVNTDLEMYDIKVTFGNGEVFLPGVRVHFQDGSWSRLIDFPGGFRHIKRIEFWYRATRPGPGQAKMVVWGLR